MGDQPIDGVEDLDNILSDEPENEAPEAEEQELEEQEPLEAESDEEEGQQDEEKVEEVEQKAEEEVEKYEVTVKNSAGEDEVKQLTLPELAEGYMLNSDYTRKRQAEVETLRQKEQEFHNAAIQTHTQSAEAIDQLKAFVIQSAAPELSELTPQLAATDPARYVELQAKHASIEQTIGQLEQTKSETLQQSQQVEIEARTQRQTLDREYIAEKIPEFNDDGYQSRAVEFASKTYGITPDDLAFLTSAPVFKAGGVLDGGKLVHMLSDAMKFHNLETQKPIQMKKVTKAPRVIKPNAPKARRSNREAEKRLKDTGSIDALAALL